jgi:hypothetical protein
MYSAGAATFMLNEGVQSGRSLEYAPPRIHQSLVLIGNIYRLLLEILNGLGSNPVGTHCNRT